MSYCVNCGVELKDSEKRCPLCDTIVLNPKTFGKEKIPDEPKKEYESIPGIRVDYKLLSTIISVLLIIPVAVTFICDFVQNHTVTWSLYVLGASLLTFVVALLPAFFKSNRPYKFIAIDSVCTFLFLWLICHLTHGNWMFTVALPLTAATCAFSLVYAVALRSKRIYKLYKLSLFIILAGIFTLCVEVILNDAFGHALMLRWSHFVIIPCAVVSIILVIVGSQKRVRDELKKRLFM